MTYPSYDQVATVTYPSYHRDSVPRLLPPLPPSADRLQSHDPYPLPSLAPPQPEHHPSPADEPADHGPDAASAAAAAAAAAAAQKRERERERVRGTLVAWYVAVAVGAAWLAGRHCGPG